MHTCYSAILKSIGGLALFQVANGAIDLFRHIFMRFCEYKLRYNSFWFAVARSIVGMLMYLVLGIVLLYVSKEDDIQNNRKTNRSDKDEEKPIERKDTDRLS